MEAIAEQGAPAAAPAAAPSDTDAARQQAASRRSVHFVGQPPQDIAPSPAPPPPSARDGDREGEEAVSQPPATQDIPAQEQAAGMKETR